MSAGPSHRLQASPRQADTQTLSSLYTSLSHHWIRDQRLNVSVDRQCKIIERQVCDSIPSEECQLVPKERISTYHLIILRPADFNSVDDDDNDLSHRNNATLLNVRSVSMYPGKTFQKDFVNQCFEQESL